MSTSATPSEVPAILRTCQVGDPDPTPSLDNRGDYCLIGVGELVGNDEFDRFYYCTWPATEPHDQHVAGCAGEVVAVRDDVGVLDTERAWTLARREIQQAMDNGTHDPGAPVTDSAPPAPVGIGVDPQLLRQVKAWEDERKEHSRRIKELVALIDEGQAQLTEQYVAAGTDEIRLDGIKGTLRSTIWARKRAEETTAAEIAAALRADGLAHMVTPEGYNSNVLSAWLRDLEAEGKPIPPNVAKLIEPSEVWKVGFTSSRPSRARARMAGAASSVLDGAPDGASGR